MVSSVSGRLLRRLRPLVPRSYLRFTAPLGPAFAGHGLQCFWSPPPSAPPAPVGVRVIVKELALWALRKRRPWRVQGTSMEPDFCDGDLVFIDADALTKAGTVVVARHPFKNLDVIKYVKSIDADGYVVLESPAGDDSEQFGRVPLHTIRGTVTFNWKTRSAS